MKPEPDDLRWMTLALDEAARGLGQTEPNPMVGAVVEDDGRLLSLGHHARFGGPHAEVAAIEAAGGSLTGSTMHVSLEPCCHFGKTPPCADAILKAGPSRVVVATRDPFPQVSGGGIAKLRAAGIRVDVWPFDSEIADRAIALNRPFFKRVLTGLPYVVAKWAMSLDGRIALSSGDSRWISSDRSRAVVHELRGRCDAVIVGIGTVLADDPALTARPPGPRTAVRVVVDPEARLPTDSQLARTARETPVRLYCSEDAEISNRVALAAVGCEVVPLRTEPDRSLSPHSILEDLGQRGATVVLVEGGSRLLGRFFESDCIDEIQAFVAPVLFGGPAAFPPLLGKSVSTMEQSPRLESLRRVHIGTDTLFVGDVPSAWSAELHRKLGE